MNRPAGLIFDMDDTLVATSPLWRQAETHLLKAIGHHWSAELALNYKGMNALDVAATIHRLLQPARSVESCQKIMREALFAAFENGKLEPMPGAISCVRALTGIAPLAVASGSPLPLIELAMHRLGIRDAFTVLLSSESVARGKPSPDIFLAAAQALGAAPNRCLIFEDSLIGVQAACAANIPCIAVPSSRPQEIAQLATRTYTSLAEVTREDVTSVFNLP